MPTLHAFDVPSLSSALQTASASVSSAKTAVRLHGCFARHLRKQSAQKRNDMQENNW
jgi:hypothetical protein